MDIELAISILQSYSLNVSSDSRKEIVDFINQQAETIESLKCCGNCVHNSYDESGVWCPKGSNCTRYYLDQGDKDLWQPIN